MQHYKFGQPEGRFVGKFGKYNVYSGSISPADPSEGPVKVQKHHVPGEFDFYYGPSTGGLIESIGFKLTTPGETIVSVEADASYKRRKIAIRGLSVDDAILRVERINGFHSASNTIAFLEAVEDASGIQSDPMVRKSRIAALELERIRSHLEVLKRMAEPAGFGVPVNQIGYLREKTSRIISEAFGHRFFFGSLKVNRVLIEPANIARKVAGISKEFGRIFDNIQESKIFLNRLQTTGITNLEEMVGPVARAAGLEYDARYDSPTLDYRGLGFRPVLRDEKDSFGRLMVRGQEILESCSILENLDIEYSGNDFNSGLKDGEGAARIESPAGDLFYYVKLQEGKIEDIGMVSPSYLNIKAFEQSMKENLFPDFNTNWEGFGVWASEMEVDLE